MALLKSIDIDAYCVIDYIAYRGAFGQPIVKELAVFIPSQGRHCTWVFYRQKRGLRRLYKKTQITNRELQQNRGYEIKWEEGDVPYCHMRHIVNRVTQDFKFVVVAVGNGDEGAKFITEIIGRKAYDMASLMASHVDFDAIISGNDDAEYCMYHSKENRNACPLRCGMIFSTYFHKVLKNAKELSTPFENNLVSADEDDSDLEIVFQRYADEPPGNVIIKLPS